MKILKPQEYVESTNNYNLDSYVVYLSDIKTKLEEALNEAKEMQLEQSVVDNLENQLNDILDILNFLEKHLYKVVLASIENLTLEELKTYSEEEGDTLRAEIKDLEDELSALKSSLDNLNSQIESEQSRENKFKAMFSIEDTNEFFKYDESEEFARFLLDTDLNEESLRVWIEEAIDRVIKEDEGSIDLAKKTSLVNDALARLRKVKNIIQYSPEAKEELIAKIISSDEFNPLVEINMQECESVMIDILGRMILLLKEKTEFFKGLDEDVQNALLCCRFDGETYYQLKDYYEMIKAGKHLPSHEHIQKLIEKRDACEEEYSKIKKRFQEKKNSLNRFEQFLDDGAAMRKKLYNQICHAIEEDTTLEDVEKAIEDYCSNRESLEKDLRSKELEISTKRSNIEEARDILNEDNSAFRSFFYAVSQSNLSRILKDLGVDYSSACVEPIIDAEKKRLEQIEWMCSLQGELQVIEGKIRSLKAKSNPITKLTKRYKRALDELEKEYASVKTKKFKESQEKDLLHISSPQYTFDYTIEGQPVRVPKVASVMVSTFDEIFTVEHFFWDFSTPLSKVANDRIANRIYEKDWDYITGTTMPLQRALVKKLWYCQTDENGHYIFKMTETERNRLIQLQKDIIYIAQEIEKEQRYYSVNIDSARTSYTNGSFWKEKEKLRELGIIGENEAAVTSFIAESEKVISKNIAYLQAYSSLCEEFGIEVPKNPEVADQSPDLDKPIKDLHIPGVTTVSEAKDYMAMLKSLELFTISEESVKTFYIDRVKKN